MQPPDNIPAIEGLDDASRVRVMLYQSGRTVHAPVDAVGLQPLDAGLTDIAALAVTDGNIIVGDGTNWVAESGSTARTSLGLGTGDSPTFTGVTATSSLILPQSTTPTPTAEGSLQWDTDDNAIVVGDGAAQKIFRASHWEHIGTTAISSAASWETTGLSAYRRLRIVGWARPATDGVSAFIRTDANGGASYDAGASDYSVQVLRATSTTVSSATAAIAQIGLNTVTTIGNVAPEGIWFEVEVFEFNQARECYFKYSSTWFDGTPALTTMVGGGHRASAAARDAIQFIFSSGNIAIGEIEIYGRRG